jgi:lysophospholipase L1-like esterase
MSKVCNVAADLRIGDASTSAAANTAFVRSWPLRGSGTDLGIILGAWIAAGTATPAYTCTAEYRLNNTGAWSFFRQAGSTTISVPSGGSVQTDLAAVTWTSSDRVQVRLTVLSTVNVPQSNFGVNDVAEASGAYWVPFGIVSTQADSALSVIGFGDSISAGTGRGAANSFKQGVTNTAYRASLPCVTMAVPGGLLSSFVSAGAGAPFISWIGLLNPSDIVQQASVNDIGTRTANQIAGDIATMAARFATAEPGVRVWQTVTTPNNATNLASATVVERTRLVDLIRAGISGVIGYIDIARLLETGRNSNAWLDSTLSTDSTHPSDAGYEAIKEVYPSPAELAALTPALSSAPADSGIVTLIDRAGLQEGGTTAAVLQVRRLGDAAPLPTANVTLTSLGHGQWQVSQAAGLPASVVLLDLDTTNLLNLQSGRRYRSVMLGADSLGYAMVQVIDPATGEIVVGTTPTITDALGGPRQLRAYPYGVYAGPQFGAASITLDPGAWYGDLGELASPSLSVDTSLVTMIEQIGTTGVWRLAQSAFPTAPSTWGGSTQVRVGGGRLSPVASGLDDQITSFVSDVLPLRFDLEGQDGQAISNVGATLTGTLTNAAGTVQAGAVSILTTGLNVAEGELLATVTLPATAGTYQLTITRTASASDVQTFGPFAIKAGRK